MFRIAFRSLVRNGSSKPCNGHRGGRLSRRLAFEPLEERRVLATLTVTSLSDAAVTGAGSAPGTLRQAIYDANSTLESDVIQFAPELAGNINLSVSDDSAFGASAILITSAITIRGNTNGITISRDPSALEMRLFRVSSTGIVTFDSLTLSGGIVRGINGTTPGENGGNAIGGAVLNQGKVQFLSSTIYANQAIGGNAGPGARGGAGLGGAVYNDGGTIEVSNATFSGNSVQSGTSNTVPSSFGGAIYSKNGFTTVHNSTITNSTASTGRGIYILAVEGTATADIRSTIIGQGGNPQAQVREFLTAPDTNGFLAITGQNNLIRSQGDFSEITVSIADPQLGLLANNGGPTLTHALLTNSPAINIGSSLPTLVTDQRGGSFARVVGGFADIGAFELQSVAGPALPGDYNGNQSVDAADYVLWRKSQGTSVPQYTGADGSGNSVVDDDDYGVWRVHFGATPSGGASVALSASEAPTTNVVSGTASMGIIALVDEASSAGDMPTNATDSGLYTTERSAFLDQSQQLNLGLIALAREDSPEPGRSGPLRVHSNPEVAAGNPGIINCAVHVLDDMWAAWSISSNCSV